ncbi:unnamed protein product [Adineta ricciae]|uniref:Uncharacterized protein n=1 Tax=Adineta ricciae TaxID=249248 RepID=A0A814ZX66_ADIRI|nr:unnamed protein product [Adineta ricciae]
MWIIKLIFLILFYLSITDRTTEASNYTCDETDTQVEFSLSVLSHSGQNQLSNCLLQSCNSYSSNNGTCRLESTPCFDYRTSNNRSFCAPGIQCSILESCDNITHTCSSREMCLPIVTTRFCRRVNY